MTNCKKCGAHIKHIHNFNGEQYGGDCVQVVAGITSWEVRTAGSNIDAYMERKAERAAKAKLQEEAEAIRKAHFTAENGWLIDFLEQQSGHFALSMAHALSHNDFNSLSPNQKDALLNIWINSYSGITQGLAMAEFVAATEGIQPYEILEVQIGVASYATLAELKALLKENGIKGYSKLGREALEDLAAPFIKVV